MIYVYHQHLKKKKSFFGDCQIVEYQIKDSQPVQIKD